MEKRWPIPKHVRPAPCYWKVTKLCWRYQHFHATELGWPSCKSKSASIDWSAIVILGINRTCQDFVSKLKAHLLPRIQEIHLGKESEDGLEPDQPPSITQVCFKANHIYHHNLLRINHTTYDVHCETDMINPRTEHSNIMLLNEMGPTISFAMLVFWPFTMPMSYTQGQDQRTSCHAASNFCGYGGWNWSTFQLDGTLGCWTKWSLCQWTEQMHSVLLTQGTYWGAVTLCLFLQLANYISIGHHSQETLVTQRTGYYVNRWVFAVASFGFKCWFHLHARYLDLSIMIWWCDTTGDTVWGTCMPSHQIWVRRTACN